MKSEIEAAVIFLTRLVKKNQKLTEEQVEEFSKRLIDLLGDKFKNHWYQDDPEKGQAYRCIRMNETVTRDPVIEQAATDSGLVYGDLKLPTELTVWVDPKEVCCRFGENKGSCCTLFKEGQEDSQVIEKVLGQAQVKVNSNRPIEITRINQRSGTPSPPSTQQPRGPHPFYGNSNNSNMNSGPHGRNSHHNHNHNNNTTHKFKPFPQNKFRQPPPPLPNKHSVSPTFVKGNKMAPSSPPKSFKAQHPQFQQHVSASSRNDRFHWVRGADLVKA